MGQVCPRGRSLSSAAETFTLTDVGRITRQELLGIHGRVEQVKIGHYQIMPDHLHAMVHVVRDLPAGLTLQRVIRGFKIGLNRKCREAFGQASFQVFVSPFISPYEKRILHEVAARGGRAIRLSHEFFGERYKPAGERFDFCCTGRLLEVSVAGAFARYARLDREACLRMNQVAGLIAAPQIATPEWSQ